ncbi:MAG: hypothetical protein AB1405_10405 [Bdellovibrionota bacterium]
MAGRFSFAGIRFCAGLVCLALLSSCASADPLYIFENQSAHAVPIPEGPPLPPNGKIEVPRSALERWYWAKEKWPWDVQAVRTLYRPEAACRPYIRNLFPGTRPEVMFQIKPDGRLYALPKDEKADSQNQPPGFPLRPAAWPPEPPAPKQAAMLAR